MPTVIIPPPYQGPTQGVGRVDVAGETLRDCLDALEKSYPGFRAQVVDADGRVHRFVKLFVNRALVPAGDLGARLADDDELEIVAAIAGG
ncbi:MAG TPA: MoaD/ThiS family protein [Myxococcota bacterium]|jgi:molybdopterin converting factor small subunit|nr:MoaD/ThiS family protein [Myxococcota bacterium]